MILTAGEDHLDYSAYPSFPAVFFLHVKLHPNSVIFDTSKIVCYLCIDYKDFYLGTPVSFYQYMKVHKRYIPNKIFKEYKILIDDLGYNYVKIRRSIDVLKEAGGLVHQ